MSETRITLWTRSVAVDTDDTGVELTDEQGWRHILSGQRTIASEGIDEWGRLGRALIRIRDTKLNAMELLSRKADIALLGGGLCILARLLGPYHRIKVYEIEPPLVRYLPPFATFVAGDWHVTLDGLFDVIVLDTGESLEGNNFAAFLKPGGIAVSGG